MTIVTKEKYNGWLITFKSSKVKLWRFIIDSRAEVIKQTVSKWGVSQKTAESYYLKYIPDLIALLATDETERRQYLEEHYFACNKAKYEAHLFEQKKNEKGIESNKTAKVRVINKWSRGELRFLVSLRDDYKYEWAIIASKLNTSYHNNKPIRTKHIAAARYSGIKRKEFKYASTKENAPKVNKGAKQENDKIILDATKEAKVMSFNDTQKSISVMCDKIKTMLLGKNKQYGDSVMNPIRVFSKADKTEQLRVRIDDKINRLLQGDESIESDVDVIDDLIGYLILLRITMEE